MRSAPASMNSRWISEMIPGCVMTSRSLQPLRSRGHAAKRSPRYAASSSLRFWIIVPIAPSRITMRSAKSLRSAAARATWSGLELLIGGFFRGSERLRGTDTERVADRVRELGAVQRVEVELVDAMALQRVHLFDRDGGRDQLARVRVVLETVETVL